MLNRILLWSHLVLDFCLLEIVFLCFTFSGSNCSISFLIKLPKSSPKSPPWNRYSQLQPSRASALGGSSTRQDFRLFSSYWVLRLTSSFLVRLFNRAGNIYGRPLQRGAEPGQGQEELATPGAAESLYPPSGLAASKGPPTETPTPSGWSKAVVGRVRDPRLQPGISPSALKQGRGSREPSGMFPPKWKGLYLWVCISDRKKHGSRAGRKWGMREPEWEAWKERKKETAQSETSEISLRKVADFIWRTKSGAWIVNCDEDSEVRLSAKVCHDWLFTSGHTEMGDMHARAFVP